MASTYTTSLQIQEIATGEQSGVWGTTTNTNWTLIEQAVAGVQNITMSNADYTLSVLNGVSDEARNMVLVVGGTNSAIRKIVAPLVTKIYFVKNSTSGGYAITIGGTTGSAVTIPNGTSAAVYCDGTNFYQVINSSAGDFNVSGNLTVNGTTTTNAITGTTITAGTQFSGPGTGLTGTAASLSIGGTANVANTASVSTNLAGGATNQIAYQSAANSTAFISTPSSGTYLYFNGTNYTWQGSTGGTTQAVTFNNGGAGNASGTSFNGSTAVTISYNTLGASPTGGNTSLITTGNVTTGTWSANVIGAAYGGTGVGGTLTGVMYANGAGSATAATGTQITSAIGSNAVSVSTNIAGGSAGSVPYQSGANTTSLLSVGSANTVMTSSGTAPQWSTSLNLSGTGAFGGNVTAPNLQGPAFSAYQTNTQTPAANTPTKLLYQSELFDTNNCFSSSTFTPNVAGYYQINAAVNVAATTDVMLIYIYKNGAAYKRGTQLATGASGNLYAVNVSGLVYCNGTTDYIEIYYYMGTPTATDVTSSTLNYFDGCLVRSA